MNTTMTGDEVELLRDSLFSSRSYLEYGAGHSTLMAAGFSGLSITSVESDLQFLRDHMLAYPEIKEVISRESLRFLSVDIGPTRDWGHPCDKSKSFLWPNYALCPYRTLFQPDLVLVDGRFRVACVLVAFLASPNATILIHDYGRTRYHVIEQFAEIEARVDSLLRCKRLSSAIDNEIKPLLESYLYLPDDH